MYPSISLDSLTFQYAEVSHFYTISSYYELIGKLFNPSDPKQMDRFPASVLRENYSRKR